MTQRHHITPSEALQRTIEHREIFHDEMLHLMRLIMNGEISPLMTAAIITGLRVKKETIGEITAAAQVMREFSTKVSVADPTHLVDIVGTGGDGSHTFNISTLAPKPPSTAGAASAAKAAAPTCSKAWAPTSTSNPTKSHVASLRQASVLCLRPTITRP
jgi:anthranilate phosphoribosyltransferase